MRAAIGVEGGTADHFDQIAGERDAHIRIPVLGAGRHALEVLLRVVKRSVCGQVSPC